MIIIKKNFNKNLKYIRLKKKMSQEELAEKIGTNRANISRWENGTNEIPLEMGVKIADAFNISIGDFVSQDLKIESDVFLDKSNDTNKTIQENSKEFSNRLKQSLENKNIKPVELAKKLNVNRGIISQYLNGKYKPNQKRIYEIARILNVNEAWLDGYDLDIETINIYNSILIKKINNLDNKYKKLLIYIINYLEEMDN